MTRRLLFLVAVAVTAVSCTPGDGDGGDNNPTGQEARLRTASDGLCRTLELVDAGDLKQARVVFEDRSHDYLHEIAAKGLDAVPRETEAVLENKQVVEQGLTPGEEPPAELLQALFDLQSAMADLAVELGLPRVEPCRGAVA